MPKIVYVNADGSQIDVEAQIGTTLMQAAVNGGVSGIVGECGGACQCATCHIYVTAPWRERLPPRTAHEDAMLDNTIAERREGSRLSCEIEVKAEYDGLVVHLPDRQI